MDNSSDRNAGGVNDKNRSQTHSDGNESGSEQHLHKSGERTFSEPDNPPARQGGPKTDTSRTEKEKQQTGGPGKPTA